MTLPHDHNGTSSNLPPELQDAAAELVSLRRLAVERAALAGAAALLAGLVAPLDFRLGVALAAGSVGGLALAGVAEMRRRAVLLVLAADPNGYAIAEVREFGASLVSWRGRTSIAGTIKTTLLEASRPNSLFLLDRVAAQAPVLTAIARSLMEPATLVEPYAMAALLLLLTDGDRSPLLNPNTTTTDLDRALARIDGGIRTTAGDGDRP